MDKNSRTANSMRNIVFAVITQAVSMIIGLVLRTFFINYLGEEYLGMNQLFTSALKIISMTEMGFTTVAVVSLYQPIAENDRGRLAQFVAYYRKVYLIIAGITILIGVVLTPFLPFFAKTEAPIEGLYLYYWLFVINSAVSYLSSYKLLVIEASQKQYLISKQTMYVNMAFTVIQIVCMLLFKNYILYLVLMIAETFFTNYMSSRKVKKIYPDFTLRNAGKLDKEATKEIWKDTYNNFTYKTGTLLLSNSGDVFISAFAGTAILGLYSNYALFLNIVKTVLKSIYEQIYNSIGNLNSTADAKKREEIFDVCVMIYAFLLTVALSGIYCLGDDVITIWLGERFILDRKVLGMACLNNYFYLISYPILTFRVTSKYMKESRYLSLISATIAVGFGALFGSRVGIIGVLGATALARVATLFWYEPYILYKKVFEGSFAKYIIKQMKYMLGIIINCAIQQFVLQYYVNVSLGAVIVKCMLSVICSSFIFMLMNGMTKEFRYLFRVARNIRK